MDLRKAAPHVKKLSIVHSGQYRVKTTAQLGAFQYATRHRSAKVAPATSARRRAAARDVVLSPAQAQKAANKQQTLAPDIYNVILTYYESAGQTGQQPEEVSQFAKSLSELLSQQTDDRRQHDSRATTNLLRQHPSFSASAIVDMALYLIRQPGYSSTGWRLMLMLAEEGSIRATLVLLMGWLRQTALKPNVLRGERVGKEIARLSRFLRSSSSKAVSSSEQHVPRAEALRIEAMLLTRVGQQDKALATLEEAWRLTDPTGFTPLASPLDQSRDRLSDTTTLGEPIWNDLYAAYADKYQRIVHADRRSVPRPDEIQRLLTDMQKVLQVGLDFDDATAHYNAAKFEQHRNTNADISGSTDSISGDKTSTWLHHMTKAAISGVPEAAHELGLFYEHFQPATSQEAKSSSKDLSPASLRPAQRLTLAYDWYAAAARLYFAPAQLALARLSLHNAPATDKSMPLLLDCLGAAQAQRDYINVSHATQAAGTLSNYTSDVRVDKWRIFDRVFQQWVDSRKPYFTDMTAATAKLCDVHKLDILDEKGALLYKHN